MSSATVFRFCQKKMNASSARFFLGGKATILGGSTSIDHRIDGRIVYLYLHVVEFYGKCR